MLCAARARQLHQPQRVLEIDLAKCGPRTRLAHGCAERAEDVIRDEPVTDAIERREVRQHLPQLWRCRLAVDVTARQRNHRRPRRMRQEPSQAFATDETGRSGDERGLLRGQFAAGDAKVGSVIFISVTGPYFRAASRISDPSPITTMARSPDFAKSRSIVVAIAAASTARTRAA